MKITGVFMIIILGMVGFLQALTPQEQEVTDLQKQVDQLQNQLVLAQSRLERARATLREANGDPPPLPGLPFALTGLHRYPSLYEEPSPAKNTMAVAGKTATPSKQPTPGPWIFDYKVGLPVTYGYETNPQRLSFDLPDPAGVSHKGSTVIQLNPSLSIGAAVSRAVTYDAAYELLRSFYQQRADINGDLHTFTLDRVQKFNDEREQLTITAAGTLLRTDEEGRMSSTANGVTYEHFWDKDKHWSTVFDYALNVFEVALPDGTKVAPVADTDNVTNTVAITQKWVLRPKNLGIEDDQPFLLSLRYLHGWVSADGADADRQRNRLEINTKGRPFPRSFGYFQPIALQLHYTHDFDAYSHPNSRAGLTGFEFDRSDNIDDATVTLSYPLDFGLVWRAARHQIGSSLLLTYRYTRQDSNIRGQDFDDHAIRLGVEADF